jgi:hypothetical protein
MMQMMLSLPVDKWLEVVCRANFFGGFEMPPGSKVVQRLSENGGIGKASLQNWDSVVSEGVP